MKSGMLIHAALIQSDFFFSPSKSKIFPIIFFVWFVFNRKWENSIDNKKRSMHNCYIRINNCVCCFEAEHSKMHQTWMIPIETFRFRLQRLFLSECHLVRQQNIDTSKHIFFKKCVGVFRFLILSRSSHLYHRSASPSYLFFYLKIPKIDLMYTLTHPTEPQIFMTK